MACGTSVPLAYACPKAKLEVTGTPWGSVFDTAAPSHPVQTAINPRFS
jgi:hypothetical protein